MQNTRLEHSTSENVPSAAGDGNRWGRKAHPPRAQLLTNTDGATFNALSNVKVYKRTLAMESGALTLTLERFSSVTTF